jgi:hypothetical protein
MKFSYLLQPQNKIFDKKDLNHFKQQQLHNSMLLTKYPLPYTNKIKVENFFMEENNEDTDSTTNIILNDDSENKHEMYNEPRFNIDRMMKLDSKGTYDAYEGSEIKVNNPPIAPYPFGPK